MFKRIMILCMIMLMAFINGCGENKQDEKIKETVVAPENDAEDQKIEETIKSPIENKSESEEIPAYLHIFKDIGIVEDQSVEFRIYSTIDDINQQPGIGQYKNYDIADVETQGRIIKDLNAIKVQKIDEIEQSFDEAIDISIDQDVRYWKHSSTRLLYDAESDTYILKKDAGDDDWYLVMEGKETCEDLFLIARQLISK